MDFVVGAVPDDRRGWILCVVSAIACVFGACIICVDVFVRLVPGQKDFRIEDSNAFLSGSLSLSFGVMIFSALFSMLPSSKRYLLDDGVPRQRAGLLMMAAFVAGFVGIQVVSRIIHRFMPSHVVDCDHSHDEDAAEDGVHALHGHVHHGHKIGHGHVHGHVHGHGHGHAPFHVHAHFGGLQRPPSRQRQPRRRSSAHTGVDGGSDVTEATPLLAGTGHAMPPPQRQMSAHSDAFSAARDEPLPLVRRQSMGGRLMSFVKDTKPSCDEYGPCYGYSDPCGQECRTHLATRTPALQRELPATVGERSNGGVGVGSSAGTITSIQGRSLVEVREDGGAASVADSKDGPGEDGRGAAREQPLLDGSAPVHAHGIGDDVDDVDLEAGALAETETPTATATATSTATTSSTAPHHHHVPTNAFMSIGVQTVLAIGLHKFPEGFITFATNHANPALGLNVFLALLVHNVAEGFAMALPLYMALGSRLRAILWASALGGLSQPLGAAVAAVWLHYLGRGAGNDGKEGKDGKDGKNANGTAYGLLFAVTAGIMVAVALQLFVEGLSLHHNRQLCITFGFVGMLLLGLSNSLVKG